jgi:hypothetical protein
MPFDLVSRTVKPNDAQRTDEIAPKPIADCQIVQPGHGSPNVADGLHRDGKLAAPATFLKPELRQRFAHPVSPPDVG